ncbi:hypothetical protein EMIHUDRAFT_466107 [Emiliania huxleyi CCMP1516]|uniref:N-acetyltransferase domain-containing protein n=2 Tax=Emiliania huxleyi TaxID=2903 RepID=A0A0D3I165_EMIH1|nr:hypothetical protein EMIHUDRAFT_466107 [Emiliania huxleyi CCMP1516]EOD05000.1 hypothetical protein EMIHUDRAFT_466107 [Emiliania huxleyi CCMP1516]|eukprot:XP_005757429.1 hypothetical protein EMIHUDRAFT_466107 [Emiliania huxleyi CCMP1516]
MLSALSCCALSFSIQRGIDGVLSTRLPQPVAAASIAFEITSVRGDDASLDRAARFFVEGFWAASTTTDTGGALTDRDRDQLAALQRDDMIARYGETVGARRLRSSLFVAEDPSSGAIAGCVGVEMALVDPSRGRVLSRAQSEKLFSDELNSMGARERGTYRKMSAAELTEALFPEYKCLALLANLAVAPAARGSGLGRRLCARCDEAADDWELPAIMLQVELANAPARKLYEAAGYGAVFADEGASALRVKPGGAELQLESVPSTLLLMGKGV